ncbi:MAG: hypothetical protein NTU53_06720 [Planctomycetota bacterium]|nr:hypothetical protein [Planctomycetota bacterium]
MTLREQILASPETLSDLAAAAEQRFREAEHLLCAGRFVGAIYLFGLASEMWLKLACFRWRGANPATRVVGLLGPARTWMAQNARTIKPESYHSLLFWAEYLIRLRLLQKNPIEALRLGQLRHHVINRLYNDWRIDMRYHPLAISEHQAWRVYNDVLWIRLTWPELWR